jgi:hypothetical protein
MSTVVIVVVAVIDHILGSNRARARFPRTDRAFIKRGRAECDERTKEKKEKYVLLNRIIYVHVNVVHITHARLPVQFFSSPPFALLFHI